VPPDRPLPRTAGRIQDHRLLLADAHRARLRARVPEGGWFETAFDDLLQALLPGGDGVLRIRLDVEGRQLWAHREPLPATPDPYRLLVRPHPLPRAEAPRIKGLDGAWSAPVLAEVRALGAADALLCWPDGTVAETAIAAVALEAGADLWCPPLAGRVASLAEQHLLPGWARDRGLRIREGVLRPELLPGGRLWCLNAVRGVWPAEAMDLTPVGSG
jgi:branched-subunit amino acid aminotransferase/4-amino-4-deoxychorismate lyase